MPILGSRESKISSDQIVVQTIRLIHGFLCELDFGDSLGSFSQQILRFAIDSLVKIMKLMGVSKLDPTTIKDEKFVDMDSRRPFLWHARSSLVNLILHLSSFSTNLEWIDVFVADEASSTSEIIARSSSFYEELPEPGSSPPSSNSLDLIKPSETPTRKYTKKRSPILSLMLLEPKIRAASMHIILSVITICANDFAGNHKYYNKKTYKNNKA